MTKTTEEIRLALSGPCPSLRTPFDSQGHIDYDALSNQIEFLIDAGATNVILTHGDSLLSLLNEVEIADLTRFVTSQVKNRALVVAATDAWATPKTREFAEFCAGVGADVLMVLPCDWALSCTVPTLVEHYRQASQHMPVMLVTNFLGAGGGMGSHGQDFAFKLFRRLYEEVPGVVSVKDDVCNAFARKLCMETNDRWSIIAGGWKDNHLNMLPYGVDGYLSLMLFLKPELAWEYYQATTEKRLDDASRIIREYDLPLREMLVSNFNFDAAIHGMLEIKGICSRYRRLPYGSLSDAEIERLRSMMKDLKLIS